ncbi:MAG: carbohydrate ABC transporter permease [Fimbriimonadaceae bacterium]
MIKRHGPAAAVFLAPYGILFLIFVLGPLFYGLWISMHNWHILSREVPFVGLANYATALNDDLFVVSLVRTAYFIVLVVPLGNALSLLFAIGLNQGFRGTQFYKVAFYLPVVLSIAVTAILWRWLYSSESGLLNYYLGTQIQWLGSPDWAMPSLALMSIWWGAGGNMLIYLAALKAVPKQLLEAASLDGASYWKRFWSVTWPAIKPATLFCLVISVIAASQVFGQSYILTNGGPADSTLTVMLYMYRQGFGMYQLGYASAIAYLLFLLVLGLSLVQFKLMAGALKPE